MNNSLNDKIIHAQNVLHVAVKLANTYYKKPIAICYSGGKDSDVLLDITTGLWCRRIPKRYMDLYAG